MACKPRAALRWGIVTGLVVETRIAETIFAGNSRALPPVPVGAPGGPSLAEAAAQRAGQAGAALIAAGAQGLLSFGMAGALAPALAPGDLILPDEILPWNGTAIPTCAPWRQKAAEGLAEAGIRIHGGRLLGSDAPIARAMAKTSLHVESGALAVDMESHGVARAATFARVPVLSLRAIVDRADENLPRSALAAWGGAGGLHPLRLVFALLARPWELPALLTLAAEARSAMASLRTAAAPLGTALGAAASDPAKDSQSQEG